MASERQYVVEETRRRRWAVYVRAESADAALRSARACGLSGPATVRAVPLSVDSEMAAAAGGES